MIRFYMGVINNISKLLGYFILVCVISFSLSQITFAEETLLKEVPKKGLVLEKGIPSYADEEFKDAPVRITVFSATWCTYCKELKQEFPKIIYSKYKKEDVAIRVWEIDSKEVVDYFQKFTDKNNIPEEIKSQIPLIFINENYPYLGYSKEITDNILQDINSILMGNKPIYGGNINNLSDKAKLNKEGLENRIEKEIMSDDTSKIYYIQAGIFDSYKFLFLIGFSLIILYMMQFTKHNRYFLGSVYLFAIVIANVLIISGRFNTVLNDTYIENLKIGLYIFLH